jgi:hypothetical protein
MSRDLPLTTLVIGLLISAGCKPRAVTLAQGRGVSPPTGLPPARQQPLQRLTRLSGPISPPRSSTTAVRLSCSRLVCGDGTTRNSRGWALKTLLMIQGQAKATEALAGR